MKGTIADIKRFAVHDGPGIRSTLFLKGCPLRCKWCHNPENLMGMPTLAWTYKLCVGCRDCEAACPVGAHNFNESEHKIDYKRCTSCGACVGACLPGALRIYGETVEAEDAARRLLEDKEFYLQSGGGITLSGGEPLLQPEFCKEILKIMKKQGIHTAVDTCGDVKWSAFELVFPYTDIFLYDLKHINSVLHQDWTGRVNRGILKNLRRLIALGSTIEIRIPIIPGFNDDDKSINQFGKFLKSIPEISAVRLLAYHNLAEAKYREVGMKYDMPQVTPPDSARMKEIKEKLSLYHERVVLSSEA